ncbi:MAG: hypothetical protein WAR77_07225, partial [Saprospiraceae bacterium]
LAPGVNYQSDKDHHDVKTNSFEIRIAPGINYMIADKWALNTKFGSLGYQSETVGDGDAFGTFGLDLSMSAILFGIEYRF